MATAEQGGSVMGIVFGDTQHCWRCKGSGKVQGLTCAVCGGGGILGAGELPVAPTTTPEQRRAEGRAKRDEILPKMATKEPRWHDNAVNWIATRPVGSEFTADDLTLTIGEPRTRNAIGAPFAFCSRRGMIELAGLEQSSRPERHASSLRRWRRI